MTKMNQDAAVAVAERMCDATHEDLLDALLEALPQPFGGGAYEILRNEVLARMAHGFLPSEEMK